MFQRLLTSLICCVAVAGPAFAVSLETRVLTSPITNKPFHAEVIPVRSGQDLYRGVTVADMGTDADGCRHSSGVSEYDLYVITDPWSYFTALSIEWDEKGRFRGYLPPEFPQWVQSKDGFHGEWAIDRQHRYSKWKQINAERGQPMVDITQWEMPQKEIPVDKKYRLAIASYAQRGYPASLIAKVALNGAWAVRVQMNTPIYHTRLAGGIEEVNDRLLRHIDDGEAFELEKWHRVYREIFTSDRLTDAGYFVAGSAYLGFQMRVGDLEGMQSTLDELTERFQGKNEDGFDVLRGLVRERRRMIRQSYLPFLEQALFHFKKALANEEFPRPKMPETILAIAECHRRIGDNPGAMAWYTCLARMSETQPRIRAEIRAADAVPAGDAPYLVLLGWQADERIAELKERGVEYHEDPPGEDAEIIRAIIHQGLGTPGYENPRWQPALGGDREAVARLLDQTGKAVLDYQFRVKTWPDSLDAMWVDGFVRDRNALNRFYSPNSGEKLLYLPPAEPTPQTTVLVVTPQPVPGPDGPRYGLFRADNTIHWVADPVLPGESWTGQ